ncbi:MAG: hypothetical protein NTY77_07210 [Elusimicrobia bacterium]|nr:hypothetical protein [Elusimicrobiota bacterium]
MNTSKLFAAAAALALAAPLAAGAVDFDQTIDVTAVLSQARQVTQDMPSAVAMASIGNIWTVADTKEVTLAPGQKESAYLDMQSTTYKDVCENPFPPYTGPICRQEVMFRDVRRFKLVLAAPIPEAWGKQTFRLRDDMMRRPTLSIEALDRTHAWEYKLPEIYEDVLLVKPLPAASKAAFQAASLTVCTLRDIVKDQCVYSCPDGREIHRPVTPQDPNGYPTIACPQVLIPF